MRKLTLLVLALLLFSVSGAALAQQTPPVFCGTLAEADCAILTHSQEAMQTLDSASFAVQVDINATNIPDLNVPLALNVTGSGAYAGLGAASSAMLEHAGNPGALLSSLASELQFDATLTVNLSPELAQMANIPASITLQERLVDGIGYFNLDTLRELMGNARVSGWYGLDLAGLLNAVVEQMPEVFGGATVNQGAMQDYEQLLANPEFYNRFMSIERTDDGSGDTATFVMDFNLAALMSSPEFSDLIKAQMQLQGQNLSEAEQGQALALVSQMFKGVTLSITEEIGISDGYTRSAAGHFVFDMTGMMRAMNNMSKGKTPTTAAPLITIDFSYSYSDFNDAPAIVAPDHPTIIPYQSLLTRSVSA